MIRVLVAEDQHMIRGALVALLTREPDMEVIAELERGEAVLDVALDLRPDVAVLDIDMPGTDGLTVAQQLHEQLPTCKDMAAVLALSPATVRNYLSNAISKVGARNRVDAVRIASVAGWL